MPTPAQSNRQGMPNVQYEYVNGKWRIKKPRSGGGGGGGAAPPFNMNKWLQQQAQRVVDERIKAIQQSQQIYLDELNKQAQERVKQGQALAAWMQGQNFPGRIQDIYRTAGSDITGYASGFGGEIKGIAEADAAQVNNMLSGTGQEARNEGQGMSDVFYGAYGWSPARKFAETGAAFASDAAMQPSFAARFAQEDAAKIQQEGLLGLKDFALQMAEARMGKGDIVSELRQQQEAAEEARFNRYLKLAALAMQRGKFAQAEQYIRLAQGDNNLAAKKQRIAALAAQGYAPDGKTPLPGYHIDPVTKKPIENGWHVNPKTGIPVKNKEAGGTASQADWGKIQSDAAKYADGLYRTKSVPIIDPATGKPAFPPAYEKKRIPYSRGEAYKALWARFEGYVKDKNRLWALINKILDLKGFKKAEK